MNKFEAAANFDDWPPNMPGKPTQAAVFALHVSSEKVEAEILWTGKFPELESAMYWAAKKEVQAVRKGGLQMASRILWQHDLTPEQAVEQARKTLEPQYKRAVSSIEAGIKPELGDGPLKEVDPSKTKGFYVEIEGPSGDDVVEPLFMPLDPPEDGTQDRP